MGVSKNNGTPKSYILIGFSGFPLFSPSILGVKSTRIFWKHPNDESTHFFGGGAGNLGHQGILKVPVQ